MDRVEAGTWGREEGYLRLSPMSPPGDCAGAVCTGR